MQHMIRYTASKCGILRAASDTGLDAALRFRWLLGRVISSNIRMLYLYFYADAILREFAVPTRGFEQAEELYLGLGEQSPYRVRRGEHRTVPGRPDSCRWPVL
jgi:hypothetical protein